MALPESISDRDKQSYRDAGTNQTKIAVTDESKEYFTAIDEVSKTLSYIGKAVIGSGQAAAVWKISRLQKTGNITLLQFADGDENFDNIWNNRAALTYS